MNALTTKDSLVLVVLMGSLGDVIRGLAIVAELKKHEPPLRIAWLVEPACADIVRLHRQIDQVLVFDRRHWRSGLLKLRKELLQLKPDITLDLQRHFKSGLFSWYSGARRRIGFHPHDAKEFNWIFQTEYLPQLGEQIPKIEHYLAFVEKLSAQKITRPLKGLQFGLNAIQAEDSRVFFGNLDRSKKIVGLVLGSRWKSKNWPIAGYQKLIELLLIDSRQFSLVLLGDKSQTESSVLLEHQRDSSRLVNLVGKTTLLQLIQIMKLLDVCVGPDSGPAHIAGAVGLPYIGLFGPTSPQRVAPWGSEQLSLQVELGCVPCYRRICPGLNTLCMRLLTPEAVFKKINQVIN